MKDVRPMEGWGIAIEGYGVFIEGAGYAVDLNPIRL